MPYIYDLKRKVKFSYMWLTFNQFILKAHLDRLLTIGCGVTTSKSASLKKTVKFKIVKKK
jgi:hypothetical protein